MVFRDGQEIVNGRDIIDRIRQNADLVDPSVPKNIQILLGHFTFGSSG